ncbi:MAG: Isoquinoline 1-oxidoreductase beta subunit [uncultured Chloroflexia bacterium]|uniref:Isoquinoline 1-oxidoreductase beta subunit n=1 Tax=uncultured Chloroflexia bacterium TaxID=1672391 RepID=A0A6J4I6Y3_9CHLR|nr:MAG: Isoquinoline 1-oxidoreductase beta subunit [uncultured Chloroflexia bacterium]
MSRPGANETRPAATGQSGTPGRAADIEPEATVIGDWLHIDADGSVVVYTGKTEVGQDIRTSLAQAVADELRLQVAAISLVMADTDRTPYDMGTVGSRTTPVMATTLRRVAAATRELLVAVAAERWQVARAELQIAAGQVAHPPTGRTIGYGQLTGGQRMNQEYSEDTPITSASQWAVAGTSVPRVDGRALVTGRIRYTADLRRPGMHWGAVLRPAAHAATLRHIDTQAAAALPGVTVVHDGSFVGVTAPTRAAARAALAAIEAEWIVPRQIDTVELFEYLREHPLPPDDPAGSGRAAVDEAGSLEAGWNAAEQVVAGTYTVAYIAHVPLEPRAAVAEWQDGRLTVWTGTQRPFGVRSELAHIFDLPESAIRVIVPPTGGTYGGKHLGDAAIEAARLARGAGRPVKLIWTREEEFSWAYFRPAGVIDVRGGVRGDGTLTAWEQATFNAGSAALRTPYAVANQRSAFHPTRAPLRQGSYRALAATANHFARESLMDELAHALRMDPLAFRLRNLQDARLRAVFEAAAARLGWGKALPEGHGAGIAGGTEKGSYVATCVEVMVDASAGTVQVVRVVQAFECGAIVNPDGLQNQVVGAIIQGLGGALWEAIDFADGRVLTRRLADYRVPRFDDIPPIEVVLLDRKDLPSAGGSETPIIGIAPAIANAVFAACGMRLRSLPLLPALRAGARPVT